MWSWARQKPKGHPHMFDALSLAIPQSSTEYDLTVTRFHAVTDTAEFRLLYLRTSSPSRPQFSNSNSTWWRSSSLLVSSLFYSSAFVSRSRNYCVTPFRSPLLYCTYFYLECIYVCYMLAPYILGCPFSSAINQFMFLNTIIMRPHNLV